MSLLLDDDYPPPQEPPYNPDAWKYWLTTMILAGLILCGIIAHARGWNW